jgi:hypothetical protein
MTFLLKVYFMIFQGDLEMSISAACTYANTYDCGPSEVFLNYMQKSTQAHNHPDSSAEAGCEALLTQPTLQAAGLTEPLMGANP